MDPRQEPPEIAKDLSQKPHRILISIQARGGTAKKSLITDDTEIGSSLTNYHLQNLMGAELVERTDEGEYEGIPQEGYTYQITDRGEKVLKAAQENYDLTPIGEGEVRRRFGDLDDDLDDLKARVDQLQVENDRLREEKDELEERFEKARDLMIEMYDDLQEIKES